MPDKPAVYIGEDAVNALVQYCRETGRQRLLLVADDITYGVLGKRVVEALCNAGLDTQTVVLEGEEGDVVVADARSVFHVLLSYDCADRVFVAVGSGTITDITRFASHRTRNPFISMPTAPSVDGFTSVGAPLIVDGVKATYHAQSPVGVFADLDTLAQAPRPMIAAGFADMIGKFTAVADWRLGHLLWDEAFDERVAQGTMAAVQKCVDHVGGIGSGSPAGIRSLMEALVDSGLYMLDFGSSHPASGAEHHYSHYWEMKLLWEKRPAILHGAKVGVATVQVAKLYEIIRSLSRQQVAQRLAGASLPSHEAERAQIVQGYGNHLADSIAAIQAPFLEMDTDAFAALKQRILDRWGEVQAIARTVPEAEQIADLLHQVGGPATVQELGLSEAELKLAAANGHYLRARFTSRKLLHFLGVDSW